MKNFIKNLYNEKDLSQGGQIHTTGGIIQLEPREYEFSEIQEAIDKLVQVKVTRLSTIEQSKRFE